MMELDEGAKKAGITVTNEIGLDPGIDHLYAIKTIEEVHFGGKITSFLSTVEACQLQRLPTTLPSLPIQIEIPHPTESATTSQRHRRLFKVL